MGENVGGGGEGEEKRWYTGDGRGEGKAASRREEFQSPREEEEGGEERRKRRRRRVRG